MWIGLLLHEGAKLEWRRGHERVRDSGVEDRSRVGLGKAGTCKSACSLILTALLFLIQQIGSYQGISLPALT